MQLGAAPVESGQAAQMAPSTEALDEAGELELSVVMPCLNEAETLGTCLQKAQQAMADHGIVGEIIVADNGSSTDGSIEIAHEFGGSRGGSGGKGLWQCFDGRNLTGPRNGM